MSQKLEANFSTLIMSIASSALMNMGLASGPDGSDTQKDLELARFNIDLLIVLKEKTKGNLVDDEGKFLGSVINDLQLKYVQAKK